MRKGRKGGREGGREGEGERKGEGEEQRDSACEVGACVCVCEREVYVEQGKLCAY